MTIVVYTNEVKKSSFICPYEAKTADALKWALRMMGITIRLNVRSHQAEWQTGEWVDAEDNCPWDHDQIWQLKEWEPLTSEAKQYLRDEMQKQVNLKFRARGLRRRIGCRAIPLAL